jgi:hypothetical protein
LNAAKPAASPLVPQETKTPLSPCPDVGALTEHVLGYRVTAQISSPDIPVILCPGFGEKVTGGEIAIRGLELLMKSFNIKQLTGTVHKVPDSRRQV